MGKGKKKKRTRVKIRGFEPEDVDPVATFFQEPSTVAGTLQIPYQSTDELRKRWTTPSAGRRTLVAEVDGQVVAMGSIVVSPRPRARHSAHLGMAVAESHRGRGVGGAMLDALLNVAEKWFGILRVELTVWVDNEHAIRLYRSRGFNIEGVTRASGLRDGLLVDSFSMSRLAKKLPFKRITAEDATNKKPPQLTAGPDPKANGNSGKKKEWDYN